MKENLIAVKEYHISAEKTRVVFRDGDDDTMTLEVDGKVFEGRALHRERTVLGRIISVQLETIPDLHAVFFSVVVPEANRPSTMRSIPVSTFAVFSTHRTTIGGPALISGQIQEYRVIQLQGNAW